MSAAMALKCVENGAVNMTHVTMDVKLAYTAVKSAFLPYDAGIKDNNKYLSVSTIDDYDNDDLEVQMILKNSFAPIIPEREMKFFSRSAPSPAIFRYGADISFGNKANGTSKRNGQRYGKPSKKGKQLFAEERKTGFVIDDGDAKFMGYDYYFEDESGFLNGKMDDLPFWRGD